MWLWLRALCKLDCTNPDLPSLGIAERGNVRDLPHLFMPGATSPPTQAGATGLPLKRGNQPTNMPRGLSPSPTRGQSPQLARKVSPRANPKAGETEVARTPRLDLVPQALVGSQWVPTQHPPTRPAPWPSSSAGLASAPGHSLSQARDPSSRSPSSLLALLARGDTS